MIGSLAYMPARATRVSAGQMPPDLSTLPYPIVPAMHALEPGRRRARRTIGAVVPWSGGGSGDGRGSITMVVAASHPDGCPRGILI
jgi:hypothetical protein